MRQRFFWATLGWIVFIAFMQRQGFNPLDIHLTSPPITSPNWEYVPFQQVVTSWMTVGGMVWTAYLVFRG